MGRREYGLAGSVAGSGGALRSLSSLLLRAFAIRKCGLQGRGGPAAHLDDEARS